MKILNNIKTTRLLIVSFFLIIVLFLLINAITLVNINKLVQNSIITEHTIEVIEHLERILSNLSDAETGQRGYLLTKDIKYLEPYSTGTIGVEKVLEKVISLTSDNPEQQERLVILEDLVRKKKIELKSTIDLTVAGEDDRVIEIVLSDQGKNIMDEIRVIVQDMKNHENYLLEVRRNNSQKSENITRVISILGSVIGTLFAISISMVITNYLSGSIKKLQKVTLEISEGNMEVSVDHEGSNEVSSLARSIEVMKQNLKQALSSLNDKALQLNIKLKEVDRARSETLILVNDLKKFKLAVDNISEVVVIADASSKVVYTNQAIEKITGYSIGETMGIKCGALWGGHMEDSFYNNMWSILNKEKKSFKGILKNKRKDGEMIDVEISLSPVLDADNNIIFYVEIMRDISKAKRIDLMKTEFISLASHQLRTPLSAMKWILEMLLEGDMGKLTKEQSKQIQNVSQSNERMINLVNGLLNVSRIESGRLSISPEPTNICQLAQQVVLELEPQISKQSILFSCNMPKELKIDIDPNLITEVYQNLIVNAIKYTPPGGKIGVTIEKDGKNIISKITDTGSGIPKQQQKSIFKKFFRASNVIKMETDGTGLGLYLAKKIIEASGGEIGFESVINKGSTFWFTLPLSGSVGHKGEVSILSNSTKSSSKITPLASST